MLKEIFDANLGQKNFYKTFEGKVWDKVPDLTEDSLFIHVLISSSRCMLKISRVMEKFNMAPDDVTIRLR